MPNKKFKVKVKVKEGLLESDNWPYGERVIGVIEVTVPEKELENPMASYALFREGEKYMYDQLIEIIIEENE